MAANESTPLVKPDAPTLMDRFQPGSVKGSVLMMLASIVGAGVVSIPYALARVGLLLGLGLLVFWGIVGYFTIYVLVDCARLSNGQTSYKSLAILTYGPGMGRFTDFILACNLFGNCVAYIIGSCNLITHTIQTFYGDGVDLGILGNIFFLRFAVIVAIIPIALFRSMAVMRFTSLYTLFVLIYLSGVSVYELVQRCNGRAGFGFAADGTGELSTGDEAPLPLGMGGGLLYCARSRLETVDLVNWDPKALLTSVPLVLFAYTCQQNMFPVYNELQRKSSRRMEKVSWRACFIAFLLYTIIAINTFLTFGPDTQSNYLMADYGKSPLMVTGVFMMGLSIMAGIPLNFFSFRVVVFEMFGVGRASHTLWLSFTLISMAVLWIVSCSVDDIAAVLGVLGATTNPLIVFIFPFLFWARLLPRSVDGSMDKRLTVLGVVSLLGGAVSVLSLLDKFGLTTH